MQEIKQRLFDNQFTLEHIRCGRIPRQMSTFISREIESYLLEVFHDRSSLIFGSLLGNSTLFSKSFKKAKLQRTPCPLMVNTMVKEFCQFLQPKRQGRCICYAACKLILKNKIYKMYLELNEFSLCFNIINKKPNSIFIIIYLKSSKCEIDISV